MSTTTNTTVLTTPEYWDCECDKDYIHHAHELFCQRCGAFKDDQPDARVDEVKAAGLPLADPTRIIEIEAEVLAHAQAALERAAEAINALLETMNNIGIDEDTVGITIGDQTLQLRQDETMKALVRARHEATYAEDMALTLAEALNNKEDKQ